MDPATILILLGAFYALKTGWKGVKIARAAASQAAIPGGARRNGSAGGGMPGWLDRRRHTGSGWWAGEARHGFPVFRAGVREGWTNHQTAMAQRQAELAGHRADHTERQNTYKAERDAHRRRLEEIERQERERQEAERKAEAARAAAARPPISPPAGSNGSSPNGRPPGPPVMAPPRTTPRPPSTGRGGQPAARPATSPPSPGDGNTDGNGQYINDPATQPPIGPDAWKDDPAATCADPGCTYCGASAATPEGVPPAGSTATTTGGTMTDTSYQTTQDTCDKIQSALEAAMNDQELAAAEQLCDGLGPALPDDTETLGHAGDLVTAIKEARAAMARAMEQAAALKASHEKNHGAANEAAQATGHMAEREHHMAG